MKKPKATNKLVFCCIEKKLKIVTLDDNKENYITKGFILDFN